MSVFRKHIPDDLLYKIVSIFISQPILTNTLEIAIDSLEHTRVISSINELYEDIKDVYFPNKLSVLEEHNNTTTTYHIISYDSCIKILRQVLRARGFRVWTRTYSRHGKRSRYIIVIPPTIME